jgi:hypothetical protein
MSRAWSGGWSTPSSAPRLGRAEDDTHPHLRGPAAVLEPALVAVSIGATFATVLSGAGKGDG